MVMASMPDYAEELADRMRAFVVMVAEEGGAVLSEEEVQELVQELVPML